MLTRSIKVRTSIKERRHFWHGAARCRNINWIVAEQTHLFYTIQFNSSILRKIPI